MFKVEATENKRRRTEARDEMKATLSYNLIIKATNFFFRTVIIMINFFIIIIMIIIVITINERKTKQKTKTKNIPIIHEHK